MILIEKLEKGGAEFIEKGDRCIRRDQYKEALNEYIEGFKSLCLAWSMKVENKATYSGETKVDFWFNVLRILQRMMGCYGTVGADNYRCAFLVHNGLEILNGISQYEKDMTAEQLNYYEKCKKGIGRYAKDECSKELEQVIGGEADQYFDDQLKDIYQSLNVLCEKEEISVLPRRKIPVVKEEKNDCFVATAVYETPEHPDLDVFRNFRDNQLLTNSFGKWLVAIYYKVGPGLAQYIVNQPKLKDFVHQQLKYLAQWLRK